MNQLQWITIKDLDKDISALEISHNGVTAYIFPKRIIRYINGKNPSGREDRSYKISVYVRVTGRSDTLLAETLFISKEVNPVDLVKSNLFELLMLAEKAITDTPFRSIIALSFDAD